jgi:hypothetical protein
LILLHFAGEALVIRDVIQTSFSHCENLSVKALQLASAHGVARTVEQFDSEGLAF